MISMNGIEKYISINNNTSLEQFKTLSKTHFTINDNTILYYFNKFAVKKIIQNDSDFKNSFNSKSNKILFF